ncbi:hypothetical protein B296_00055124 [Ensete ventricosum]|uniref:Uncharacterized protein n=1 Tax=Ensete ventricosum TaxID=4639 RepID=A0A426XHS1_ENSVE|nr:hypothetical protein B296_00055124 [Ensete ventricosum]
MGRSTITILKKTSTVIYFAQSHAQSRVSIDFSCTVSKIQNTGHSRRLAHRKSYEPDLAKNSMVIYFARCRTECRVSIDFSCTISEI